MAWVKSLVQQRLAGTARGTSGRKILEEKWRDPTDHERDLARDVVHACKIVKWCEDACGWSPDGWQADYLKDRRRYKIANVTRQGGKSEVVLHDAAHTAVFKPASTILIVAPSERQSKDDLRRLVQILRRANVFMLEEAKTHVTLGNRSRILALPGSEKTIRGFASVDKLIVDEASRVSPDLYIAVRPMLAVSNGSMSLVSTPNGCQGVFYEVWEGGGDEWGKWEIKATECSRITEEFLDAERQAMSASMFEQEYMCAFTDLENAVFSNEVIQRSFDNNVKASVTDLPRPRRAV